MRVILTVLYCLSLLPCGAQRIFRPEVDSMLLTLDASKKDTGQVFTLLRIAEFHIAKNGEYDADLDSARSFIARARAINVLRPTPVGTGYIALVESLLSKEKPAGVERGHTTCRQAVSILQNAGNPYLLGKAWMALSFYGNYRDSADLAEKIACLQNALSCFERSGSIHLQGDCLENLADLYRNKDDHRKAMECGLLAIQRFRQIGYPNLQGPYINLCLVYVNGYEYDKALAAGLAAVDAIKATYDSTQQLCQVYFSVGNVYSKLSDYNNALSFFRVAFDWACKHNDVEDIYTVLNGISETLIKNGQPDTAVALLESTMRKWTCPNIPFVKLRLYRDMVASYSNNRQFDKARPWYDRLLATIKTYPGNRFFAYYAAVQYCVSSGQYAAGRALIPAYMHEMRSQSDSTMKRDAFLLLFRLDTAQHRLADAIANLLQYQRTNDSLFSAAKSREIERLQIRFAVEEKEKNITLLQKESELQKQQIASSRLMFDFSIAGAVLLLSAGFGRYRLKQRQNRELATKQLEITGQNHQLAAKQLEITVQNHQLEKLLRENEWLLREVHHRVKNNLQLIMGLLHSQSASLHDEAAVNAVLESQHRVQAMSFIHQKLYKARSVTAIAIDEYIGDLVAYLAATAKPGQHIFIERSIQPVTIDVVQAIPLGLIINEVVTNSIKYAFADKLTGRIRISLSLLPEDRISLYIADDGLGLPETFDPEAGDSFGIRLIYGLAEDLDAEIRVDTAGGLAWNLTFRRLQVESGAIA